MQTIFQPESVAVLFARVLLGILFTVQGYDKIFNLKVKTVIQTVEPSFRKIKVPEFLIKLIAYFNSYCEFICGALLVLGLFRYFSMYLLCINLLIVTLGMSVIDPVWKMDIVFPRALLLIFLLLMPGLFDVFSLDYFLATR